jgi:hypothetical protein
MLHLIAPAVALLALADIEWEADYELALERAASEGKVVFVAFHGPADARCEEFTKHHYRNRDVVSVAEATINVGATTDELERRKHPFVKGLSALENRRLAAALRESLVPANAAGVVATPQHLWLAPGGEVLLSAPFEVEEEELLWCFHEAQRLVDPAAPAAPPGARPPRRLLYGKGYRPRDGDELARGLTEEELEEALQSARSSMTARGGGGRRMANLMRIAFTDDEAAAEYIGLELSNGLLTWAGNGLLVQALHLVGVLSPASFWELAEDFVTHDDADVRREAAVVLEQLGHSGGLKVARRGWSKESERFLRGAWLRAIGACARGDKSARKLLLELAREEPEDEARASAIFALGYLDAHPDVHEFLASAVRGERELERSMAACAMALSRERSYVSLLAELIGEAPPAVSGDVAQGAGTGDDGAGDTGAAPPARDGSDAVLEDALAVLRGADLARVATHVSRATGAVAMRERVFFQDGGARARIDLGRGR